MAEWILCTLCNGDGEIPFDWVAPVEAGDPKAFQCPRCHGDGEIKLTDLGPRGMIG